MPVNEEEEDISPILQPCSICSRTFQPDALTRHERICKKTSEKNRKIFNSCKQRIEGSEIMMNPTSASKVEKIITRSNWREKHDELIKNIRAAKGEVAEIRDGSTTPKKNIPSDYIQCPSCERHFNKKAAERHINWCQSQKAYMPKRSTPNEAKERLEARTKYKAPTPSKKGKEETQIRKSAKSAEKLKEKIAKPVEWSSPENNNIRKKSGKMNSGINNVKSRKSNTGKIVNKDVRSRESGRSQGDGSQQQRLKLKEFSNSASKQSPDLDNNFSSSPNAPSHLHDMLQAKASDSHSQHTVSDGRIVGMDTSNHCEQSMNGDMTNEEEYNLIQRIVDLNSSIQANTSVYGDLNNSWNKKMFPSNHNLPEVSSCDEPTQTWPSRSCWGSNCNNTPMISSSSVRTGTPGSREGSSENIMPLFCCHCGSKYPISAAKYCCECGAKRRGFGTMTFKTELVSYSYS